MRYYPIFADIKGRPCVVIGGGEVALRKAEGLVSAGAQVTIISPGLNGGLKRLVGAKKARHIKRGYMRGDLAGAFLAVSASDSRGVNRAVFEEASSLDILVNVVDNPSLCNFIAPAVLNRGSLSIAVSTSGKSPLFARTLREGLEEAIGAEYAAFIEVLGAVRKNLLKKGVEGDKKERVIKAFVNSPLPLWIRIGDVKEINRFLQRHLGKGNTLSRLGVKIEVPRGKPRLIFDI
ncbi:MAG: bifunctional precorrin-2 dehydrogenase/sirohydrochlorin ferrochelatase [Deltaproteobacteria bacterium]|nr:bifunctional precorrin-2 dehydrogenase/sirohydrochlorin ferrochelatase [Deltaproteobacteria bacterium]